MHMKSVLLSGAALLLVASGSVKAADLSRPPPVPAPAYKAPPMVPAFSWTGFYIGGDGGYGSGTSEGTDSNFTGGFPEAYSFNVTGPIAGGFVGGNYQWGALVLGAEADWQWANLTGSQTNTPLNSLDIATTVKSYGSARGRLGYALDHWLLYGTAGWAWGTWDTSYAPHGLPPFFTNSGTSHGGWTAGAGFEYAFTSFLTCRVEYRYTDLGTISFADLASNSAEAGNRVKFSDVRAGVAFKFGGWY
jgi:outer membrane immunogenic protein